MSWLGDGLGPAWRPGRTAHGASHEQDWGGMVLHPVSSELDMAV